jgi:predicted pyridoxine 5'-phosphate oxidase superfamily flavin-nucleotide-binding protein
MPVLTHDMQRVVREQTLGFWATVCEDGSPNLSPKGTTRVWDDDRLFFAEICSPQTLTNIRRGSLVEVNVIDPFVRKGYRFKGPAMIFERGTQEFVDGIERLRAQGSSLQAALVNAIVVIEVHDAKPLISPAYDDPATTELDQLRTYQARYARLHANFEATHPTSPSKA